MTLLVENSALIRTDFPRIDIIQDSPNNHVLKYIIDPRDYNGSIESITGWIEFPNKDIKDFVVTEYSIGNKGQYLFDCPLINEIVKTSGQFSTWMNFKSQEDSICTKKYDFYVWETSKKYPCDNHPETGDQSGEIEWRNVINTPTTLGGYGIVDALSSNDFIILQCDLETGG